MSSARPAPGARSRRPLWSSPASRLKALSRRPTPPFALSHFASERESRQPACSSHPPVALCAMRVAMEAGDLRVPEIPLAPGEDDLDSNKNSQQYVFHFALHNTLLSPPSTPPEYGQKYVRQSIAGLVFPPFCPLILTRSRCSVCQRLPRNPNELIQSLYYALPSAHYHPKRWALRARPPINHLTSIGLFLAAVLARMDSPTFTVIPLACWPVKWSRTGLWSKYQRSVPVHRWSCSSA